MKDFLKTSVILIGGLLLVSSPFILDVIAINVFNSYYKSIFILLIFITISYILSFAIDLLIETVIKVVVGLKKEESFNDILRFIINFLSSYSAFWIADQLFSSVKLTMTTLVILSFIHATIFLFFENKMNSLDRKSLSK